MERGATKEFEAQGRIESAVQILEQLQQLDLGPCARDRLAMQQASHVAQIVRSAMVLASLGHETALLILIRSLVDSVFRMAWGLCDAANADDLESEANYKFRTDTKKLLSRGKVPLPNPQTGMDLKDEDIDLAGLHKKRVSVFDMADWMGLQDVYLCLYTPLSMHLHGSYSVVNSNPERLGSEELLEALAGATQIVVYMASQWMIFRRPPTSEAVLKFFFKTEEVPASAE